MSQLVAACPKCGYVISTLEQELVRFDPECPRCPSRVRDADESLPKYSDFKVVRHGPLRVAGDDGP